MANLKEIRISAAKLKKAQDAITAMRPYADKLTELLQNLSASLDGDSGSKFSDNRDINKVLIVAVTSNRGLAGAFNSNILKQCTVLVEETYAGKQVDFIAIGKKANDFLSKKAAVLSNHSDLYENLTFENVAVIAEDLMDKFTTGEYDRIDIVYNKFKNAATQIIMTEQFLPIVPMEGAEGSSGDYVFEPSKVEIVEQLIPKSLKTQLYKGIRDSFASEHGARMTAMHKATDNATELRDQLKLTYNKARQAAITNEILEIVARFI